MTGQFARQLVIFTAVGFFSTLLMLIFFEIIKRTKTFNVDIIKSVGSFLIQKEEHSYVLGVLIHLLYGTLCGYIYIFIFSAVPVPDLLKYGSVYTILGVGLGFNHGVLVALLVSSFFTQYHQVTKFRKAGFSLAVYQAIGHIIYGLSIGILYRLAPHLI